MANQEESCAGKTENTNDMQDSIKIDLEPKCQEARPCTCGSEAAAEKSECNCGGETSSCGCHAEHWISGYVNTPAGKIPQVSTKLEWADKLGSWKARWSSSRMDYTVAPRLYCVGTPNADSPVLVTANKKITFDREREQLDGLNAWVLVLDTKGVNVWCAAGKGTFGTQELIHRIAETKLNSIVTHRTLIVPQLGATGVSAHIVKKGSGFRVIYGPVRAQDIKAFLANGMQATEKMRQVNFTAKDRLVLAPIELVAAVKPTIIVFGVFFILNVIGFGHFNLIDLYTYLGAILIACVIVPLLLPWIPGRAFAFKGFLLGLLWAIGVGFLNGLPGMPSYGWLKAAAYVLIVPSISAFIAMNFTGSSTYTSPSGVNKEMRAGLPAMVIAGGLGILALIANDILTLAA